MWRTFALAAVIASLVAACGDEEPSGPADDDAPPPEQSPRDLWERSFTSTAVTEGGEPRPLAPDTQISVTFEERDDQGVVRWRAGCNIFGANVEITADRLMVGKIVGTAMGCRGALRKQDDWLKEFFGSDPHWQLRDDRLSLTSAETVLELEEEEARRPSDGKPRR